jgi:hypothetical protein
LVVTFLKYVPLHDIDAHLALGWMAVPETSYFHHGEYAILMEWRCSCPIREPTSPRPLPISSPSGDASEASR